MLLRPSGRASDRRLSSRRPDLFRVWPGCRRQVSSAPLFLQIQYVIYPSGALNFRVIDVGSEWRTFSNEKAGVDPSRVGGPENPLLNGSDLSTMIGPGTGAASFDAFGASKYQNRRTVSIARSQALRTQN